MTRVSGLGGPGGIGGTARGGTARPAGESFSLAAPAQQAIAALAPVSVAALIGLQDEGGEARRQGAAKRASERALGALAALQRAVLGGGAPDLDALARSAAEIELPADPALRAIVGAIRLRARVELARHGRL
ncbi:MAG TPA: flagellar assembly protein FliX [Acidiphilium sp.]|nr:flagellar assembly protein FliX [Acidiphilium sp.]